MEVFSRMFVLGGIAATHMATGHAQSQVDPNVAHLQAFFATPGMWPHILNLVGMFAVCHLRSI
jgi:hypothetical protein